MIFPQRNGGTDPDGHPEKPLHQVQLVRTLIQKHSSAFAGPGRAPVAGIVIGLAAEPVGNGPVDSADSAEFAAADELFEPPVRGHGPLVEHQTPYQFRVFFRFAYQALGFRLVDGDGFFHDHMFAVLHCQNRQIRVEIVRNGNDQRLHFRIAADLLRGGVTADVLARVRSDPVEGCRIYVTDRNEFGVMEFFDMTDMHRAHIADADNPETDLFCIHHIPFS